MTTNFPTGLDALTNPTGSSSLTSPDHAGQHTDANDAIEALQTKVGVNGSAVTSSLDYKVNNINANNITSGTLPDARLSFSGTGVSTGDISIEMGGARTGSGHCYIDMHAASGTDFESRILRLAGANGDFSFTNTGTGTMSFEQGTNAPVNFKTSSVSRIYIDTAGEVGINTTSPAAQLDVQASSGTAMRITNTGTGSSFRVEDSSGDTTPFIIDASGFVGIGVNTPTANLDIIGNQVIRASSGQDGIQLAGRAGGFGSATVKLTPDVLTLNRTLTLPNASGTVITTGNMPAMTSNYFSFVAEKVNGFAVGQNFSFGNGATTGRIPLPISCQLIYVSLAVDPAHTGSTQLQLVKNGSLVTGATITISGTTPVVFDLTANNYTFTAGNTFNWQCIGISGTLATTNGTFFFRPL